MSRYAMEELKEKLCRELDAIAEKRDLSISELDRVQKLTDSVKNICKINMYEESGGYSGAGEWEARGVYPGDYDRGSSYRRDSRGRYSSREYSREGGGYSGGSMEDHLDAMMREARSEDERRIIEDMRRRIT